MNFRRDHIAGAAVTALGLGVLAYASRYDVGSLAHVGPGFLPIVLAVLLTATGVLIALTAGADAGEPARGPDWRGWACITASVLLFVALAFYAGLAPAIFGCVFVAACGDRTARLRSTLILAATLTVCGSLLFHYALQIQLPLLRAL